MAWDLLADSVWLDASVWRFPVLFANLFSESISVLAR